jgi:hydroxymethylbilane synthase
LARAQAQQVIDALHTRFPDIECRLEVIRTRGDRLVDRPALDFDSKGLFIREIEEALRQKKIDLAVHSLKDLPTEEPVDLALGAVLRREDPRDVLISRDDLTLQQLPPGARVGTGSPRRAAQLLAYRRDLQIINLHGNVDTRLGRLESGDFNGIVLAAAGLIRLGLAERITQYLSPESILPAVGQGALAIEIRRDDESMLEIVTVLDDESTRLAITAERAFLQTLGGGCQVPIAAYGQSQWSADQAIMLELDGMVASPDGRRILREKMSGDACQAEALGSRLAKSLLSHGAREILDE